MALAANALIDIPYFKRLAHDCDIPDDEVIEDLINQASGMAERKSTRKLVAQDLDILLDPPSGCLLVLPEYPVNTITTIWVDETREWSDDTKVTDYTLETESGVLIRDYGWGYGRRSVRVQYNAGYASVPDDLKQAIVELALWLLPRQRSGVVGRKVIQDAAGMQTELEISMPLHVQRILTSDYGRKV